MGAGFSSPQLAGLDIGVATLFGIGQVGPFTTSYGFAAGDSNNFGVAATFTGTTDLVPVLTFPVATGLSTISCSSVPIDINVNTAIASLLCDIPNSVILPGTVTMQYSYADTQIVPETISFAWVIDTTGSSPTTTTTSTLLLPGDVLPTPTATSMATSVFTVLASPTTTLTGAFSTEYTGCVTTTTSLSTSSTFSSASSTSPSTSSTSSSTSGTSSSTSGTSSSTSSTSLSTFSTSLSTSSGTTSSGTTSSSSTGSVITVVVTRTHTVCPCESTSTTTPATSALWRRYAVYGGPSSTFGDLTYTVVTTIYAATIPYGTTTITVEGTTTVTEYTVTIDERTITTISGCSPTGLSTIN